jgi:small subunit ribosomal protein S1
MESTLLAVDTKSTIREEKNNHSNNQPEWFDQFLEDYDYKGPKQGQVLDGRVVRIDEDAILVDVGLKRDAIVPGRDMNKLETELLGDLSVGDQVPVFVTQTPLGDRELLVSLHQGIGYKNWEKAEEYLQDGTILELEVTGENRGGILVQFANLTGFVPNTHIPALKRVQNSQRTREIKLEMIGTIMEVQTIEVDRRKRRLIFSARKAQAEQRRNRLEELEKGQIVRGRVVNVVDFGIFVDLDGIDGLVHKSKIDWNGGQNSADLFDIGDEIEVKVIDVDVERQRVSLSRRALMPNPWDELKEKYHIGDIVKGTVTSVVSFGAFVELPVGVQGLVHVSELGYYTHQDTPNVVKPGETILVCILDIDADRERVSLSMRKVPIETQIDWLAEHWQE